MLSRIAWLMSTLISNISTDHVAVTARLNAVIERLRKLQAEQESSKEEMKRYLGSRTRLAIDTLIDHLQTPQVVEISGTLTNFQLLRSHGKLPRLPLLSFLKEDYRC